jgi:hypothetical protein
VNRLTLTFLFFVAFGWVGVRLTAAQTAQPVSAQAPVAARLPSTVVTSTSQPHGGANMPAPARSVRPNASESNQTAKEPEQTKVVRTYNGEGYFDASLADRLRPVLAKAFGTPQVVGEVSAPKSVPEALRSILGRGASNSENAGSQPRVAKSDQP